MWLSNLKIFCFSLQSGNQKLILHLLFLLKYPGNENACLLRHYSFYNFVLQVNSYRAPPEAVMSAALVNLTFHSPLNHELDMNSS